MDKNKLDKKTLEAYRKKPIPSTVPTHHAPDAAGADSPATGEHRKEKYVCDEDPIRAGIEVQKVEH